MAPKKVYALVRRLHPVVTPARKRTREGIVSLINRLVFQF